MRPTILAIGVVLVAGCLARGPEGEQGEPGADGAQGAQGERGLPGPAGGGLYTSRQNVYCKKAMGAQAAAAYRMQLECDSPKDLPLTGSCEGVNEANAHLVGNAPTGWGKDASLQSTAGWQCAWAFNPGPGPAELPQATVHLCCIQGQ